MSVAALIVLPPQFLVPPCHADHKLPAQLLHPCFFFAPSKTNLKASSTGGFSTVLFGV